MDSRCNINDNNRVHILSRRETPYVKTSLLLDMTYEVNGSHKEPGNQEPVGPAPRTEPVELELANQHKNLHY